MGSACCVAAKDCTIPNRTSPEILHRNARYSPSWSFRWENRGRVAGEVENHIDQFSRGSSGNFCLEIKEHRDVEMGDVSDGGSPLENFRTPTRQKFPVHEGTAVNLRTPAPDPSLGNDLSTVVKDLRESSAVADPPVSMVSFSVASTSCSSTSKPDPLSSQSHTLPTDSAPSMQANSSPGHHLVSNDPTLGSQGGSSDGWSMQAFSELVASSQRERWSFDCDSMCSSRGKLTRSNSRLSMSPSVDMQACGVCSKLVTERSIWSNQKIIATSELAVVAVLVCGHVFHAECLEHMTHEKDRYDPACPLCIAGEKQVYKMFRKASRMEADLRAKNNRISRNQVVDSDLEDDSIVPDNQKGSGRQGKLLKLGSSSSIRSSFGKPFLRRHFSLGSNRSRSSLLENDSPRRKGFWARYRKE
ncbi:uncharacterized protein LOC122073872 isoform X2 [Macadamia integrifolia]|uniref:uncharacterized protein LOC122073872 isoform X2 n=1 Tax=Macadamia integrifolia TaxID=60698 RepID=UPI001C4F49D8|nr:uncharacterized protein LOC122073872 isoform X2 [Macadamia integrifolia]